MGDFGCESSRGEIRSQIFSLSLKQFTLHGTLTRIPWDSHESLVAGVGWGDFLDSQQAAPPGITALVTKHAA